MRQNKFFGTEKLPSAIYSKKGTGVNFKIYNFNKSLYTITINNTEKTFFNEAPTIFKVLTDVDVSKLNSLLAEDDQGNAILDNTTFTGKVDPLLASSRVAYNEQLNLIGGLIHSYMLKHAQLKMDNQLYKDLEIILSDDCRVFKDLRSDKLECF